MQDLFGGVRHGFSLLYMDDHEPHKRHENEK